MIPETLIEKIKKQYPANSIAIKIRNLEESDIEKLLEAEIKEDDLIQIITMKYVYSNIEYLCNTEEETLNEIVTEFEEEIKAEVGNQVFEEKIEEIKNEIQEKADINVQIDITPALEKKYQVRMTLYSNYDCLNSWHLISIQGVEYDGYLKDAIDYVGISPIKIGCLLNKPDWPMKAQKREPIVKAEDFLNELQYTTSGANLLTFVGFMSLKELIKAIKTKKVIVPKGTVFGFFDTFYGAGSLFEGKTIRDAELPIGQVGETEYDCVYIGIDKLTKFNLEDVYGRELAETTFRAGGE